MTLRACLYSDRFCTDHQCIDRCKKQLLENPTSTSFVPKTLDEFLEARLADLSTQIDAITRSQAKLSDLLIERKRIWRMQGFVPKGDRRIGKKEAPCLRGGSIGATSLRLLKEKGALSFTELFNLVNETLGTSYVRTSVAPQLYRLRDKGLANIVDGKWCAI